MPQLPFLRGALPTGNVDPGTFTRTYFKDLNAYFLVADALPTVMLKDLTATNMQLAYLFGTPIRDRDFWPTFGSRIPDLLFEPCHPDTAQDIRNAAIVAVQTWQPRVRLIISRCEVVPIIDAQIFIGNFPYTYNVDGAQSDTAQVYFRSRRGFDGSDDARPPIGDGRPFLSGTRSFCARYP